jgi:hypothetical protein
VTRPFGFALTFALLVVGGFTALDGPSDVGAAETTKLRYQKIQSER